MKPRMKLKLMLAPLLVLGASALVSGAGAYEGAGPIDGGTISGTVKLSKPAPKLADKKVDANHDVCGHAQPDETYVVGKNQGLANVVVFLDGIGKGKAIGSPTASLGQQHCRYVPHVLAFPAGTELTIESADDLLHNVHATLDGETLFNIAMPIKGLKIPKVMNQTGIVKLTCDAGHPWMGAWAYVTDNPYVTVTDQDGNFTLKDVPAGSYKIKTWHEAGGEKSAQVSVSKGGTSRLDVAY